MFVKNQVAVSKPKTVVFLFQLSTIWGEEGSVPSYILHLMGWLVLVHNHKTHEMQDTARYRVQPQGH